MNKILLFLVVLAFALFVKANENASDSSLKYLEDKVAFLGSDDDCTRGNECKTDADCGCSFESCGEFHFCR